MTTTTVRIHYLSPSSLIPIFALIGRYWTSGHPLRDDCQHVDVVSPVTSSFFAPYLTAISTCSTHLSDKNFYLRGDDWLINNRWEQLVEMRDKLTFVEMVTWYVSFSTSCPNDH